FEETAAGSSGIRNPAIAAIAICVLGIGIWWFTASRKPAVPGDDTEIASLNRSIAGHIATGKFIEAASDLNLLARKPGVAAQVRLYRTSLCAALVKRGNDLISLGDLPAAQKLLNLALEFEPANTEAREALERAGSPSAPPAQSPIASQSQVVELPASPTPTVVQTVEAPVHPPQPVVQASAVEPVPVVTAPEPASAIGSSPMIVFPPSPAPAQASAAIPARETPPQAAPSQSSLETYMAAARQEIETFKGDENPSQIYEKLNALGILAGPEAVKPLKRQLAAKLATAGDLKLASDKTAAILLYGKALELDPEQIGAGAKIKLARDALEAEKMAATKKDQQDKTANRTALIADTVKLAKSFKPGFSAPKPLIAKLKSLDTAGEGARARTITLDIRDRYIKAAGDRSAMDPHGALRLLKQVTGFPGMKNDPVVKSQLAELSGKARAAGPEKPSAAVSRPEKPAAGEAEPATDEPAVTPQPDSEPAAAPSDTGTTLSQLTQPEVVGGNVNKIIQLCKELEKKKRRDEAAAYRSQAVENLIDNAEEDSANGAIDTAIADYNKALKIIPNHPGALAGRKLLEDLGRKGGASSETPEPVIEATEDTQPPESGR
ncbi:MAG TPA: hypothetical protein PKM25_10860, partial [Candidatus Ozemobacteraceae bacterium]|nr:hypothetical protein [Candidatus Ozemobacteraceae bacterium]